MKSDKRGSSGKYRVVDGKLSDSKRMVFLLGGLAALVVLAGAILQLTSTLYPATDVSAKHFSSYSDLEAFVRTNIGANNGGFYGGAGGIASTFEKSGAPIPASLQTATLGSSASSDRSGTSSDHSTTNVQVAGVDEADIVKNDGKYIYTVPGGYSNRVVIVDAYPADGANIVSQIEVNDSIQSLYVSGNSLVIIGSHYNYGPIYTATDVGTVTAVSGGSSGSSSGSAGEAVATPSVAPDAKIASGIGIMPYYRYQEPQSFIMVYDVSDHSNPVLVRNVTMEGNYYDSRMIGDYVYAIVTKPVSYDGSSPIPMPVLYSNGMERSVAASDVMYFDFPDSSYVFTNVLSINTQNPSVAVNTQTYLMGYSEQTYVSSSNIYIGYMKRMSWTDQYDAMIDGAVVPELPASVAANISSVRASGLDRNAKYEQEVAIITDYTNSLGPQAGADFMKRIETRMIAVQQQLAKQFEKTVIHKVSISDGAITYQSAGEVPGYVLNQFSMDESADGHLRVATTSGQWNWQGNTSNNLYVLDSSMQIVGKVEDMAPGERIYSARFIGDRGYMVTFRQVDPLFVLDLSDPTNPQQLGYLKVTGVSDYLHPYDATHLIGVGQEANDKGRITGFKVSLFDVSDVSNPVEMSKYVIDNMYSDNTGMYRYTYSEALYDHKAFLFSLDKNLLVLPIQVSGQGLTEFGFAPDKYGSWSGAYVFNVDLTSGFTLRGKISHDINLNLTDEQKSNLYYWDTTAQVRRSLYMDNTLYTISGSMIKANDLTTLSEVGRVELPQAPQVYYPMLYRAL
jgi:inhibitor of cysteine peptidase